MDELTPSGSAGARWRRLLAIPLALLVLVAAAALVLWLRTPERAPPPERFVRGAAAIDAETSTLAVAVDVELATLEALLDRHVPRVLVDLRDAALDGDLRIAVKVTRAGKIRIDGEGDALIAEVPVALDAEVRASTPRSRRGGPERAVRASAAARLRAALTIGLTDEWRLALKASISYRWIRNPTIKAGGRQRDVASLVDRVLDRQWPRLMQEVEGLVRKHDPVRAQVERIWGMLAAPIPIREDPPLWLVITPESLQAAAPTLEGDALRVVVGLAARLQVILGDPPTPAPPGPLPPRVDPSPEGGLRLALTAELDWDAMSAIASAALAGKTHTISKATLRPGAATIYPSGDRVVLGLAYTADVAGWTTEGTLYCAGRLELDAEGQVLRIRDFDYLLDTWDRAVASVNALAQSGIREAAAERLVFPLREPLADASARANEALAALGARTGGSVDGALDAITPRRVWMTERAAVVEVLVEGKVAVHVRDDVVDVAAGLLGE